jgi:cell wall-associated NlpC family hydrolase
VERLPAGGLEHSGVRRARTELSGAIRSGRRLWWRAAVMGSVAVLAGVLLPGVAGNAATSDPQPGLDNLVTQAKQLAHQIDVLSEQYDGLRVQLTEARAQAKTAQTTYQQDAERLVSGQTAIGQLAAESYMNGGMGSPLEILTSGDTSTLLSRAAIMQQIQQENGDRVSQLSTAVAAARRAHDTAVQQAKKVAKLAAAMADKKQVIQGKVSRLNSAAFSQAMSIFKQTGHYPNINLPTANTVGEQALQAALTREGDPYVWGAAGPSSFDCSGLVMWAYQQVGISLPHYTGAQWNMGEHISRSQLEPGDLVFFFSDISHVGLYVGDGMMLDAPSTGQVVQIQPLLPEFVGAVRIVA